MDSKAFKDIFLQFFEHELTHDQKVAANTIFKYLNSNEKNKLLLLKGYAGTGKTSLIATLIKLLPKFHYRSVLLAPTGRAAKVISSYSKRVAYTIHKKIYHKEKTDDGLVFSLAPNKHKNTIFIIDEASMIGTYAQESLMRFGVSGNLLLDLIKYVEEGENCFLMFVGDDAQLPPVGTNDSPALNENDLRLIFSGELFKAQLKHVVRQAGDSGILDLATKIRQNLLEKENSFFVSNSKDVSIVQGNELLESIENEYNKEGEEEVLIITRSNKRANIFNENIRRNILWKDNEIEAGDQLMVVKNNYYWVPEESSMSFIANGDNMVIQKMMNHTERYGFRFVDALVTMLDYPDDEPIEVKLILDTLHSESPNLGFEQQRLLYDEIWNDYYEEKNKKKRREKVFNDPFYNALQVKFSYAITCHKSQGGQWESVYIDVSYLNEEMINTDFFRWVYTAITRAKKKLFFINLPKQFVG